MNSQTKAALFVVPCLNESEHLPALLEFLIAVCGDDGLIVVADGGSADGSQKIVAQRAATDPRVVLLDNPKRLQSAGVNAAVAAYARDRQYFVRIDAHAAYPPNFISGLLEAAERTGADSVVCPMYTLGRSCFQNAVAAAQNSRLGTGGASHRMGGASGWVDHGHHALFRTQSFVGLGGYDETFSHNEDAEYDIRLTRNGGRIWMQTDVSIGYYPRSRPGALFRQYMNYGQGRARTVMRHKMTLRPRQALPLLVAPSVCAALIGLVLVRYFPVMAIAAAPFGIWFVTCLLAGLFAIRSRASRCAALSGFAAMIMHLGWSTGYWRRTLFHL